MGTVPKPPICGGDCPNLARRIVLGVYSEIEMIHRATQWARDLDKNVLYLPHRVGGKLHVLKIENGFAAARLDEGERRGGMRYFEENGKVMSVDFFLKADHARYANTSRIPRKV